MKLTFTSLFILAFYTAFAQTFSGPESVEFDPLNNRYIVANTSGGNLQSVVPGSPPVLFTANVSSPYGLVIVDSTVYVCDAGDIKGFNLFTSLQTFTSQVNGSFLNGICADASGHLFTTDFSAKKIYKVNLSDGTFNVFVNNTVKTPNGILFDAANNRLVYCTWGSGVQLKAVSLVDSTETILTTTTLSNDDGIAMDNQGRFFISVWGGQSIYMLDSALVYPPVQVITGLSNPADIYYNLSNDTLAVPNSGNNTVRFFNMSYILETKNQPDPSTNELIINPSFNEIIFSWRLNCLTGVKIEIFDFSGKELRMWEAACNGSQEISKSEFAKGIYFVTLSSGEIKLTEKFFVD